MKGSTSTNVIFAILIALMLMCILALLFLFGEWTSLNLLNVFLVPVVAYAGAATKKRYGRNIFLIGTAIISFSYFFSYCQNVDSLFGYIYAIAFAINMFAFSYFLSPRFQAKYGISSPCLNRV
ncbi:MAG: hypothetical protein ACUZ77_06920 [Candidatus Brocadiales bacterium]